MAKKDKVIAWLIKQGYESYKLGYKSHPNIMDITATRKKFVKRFRKLKPERIDTLTNLTHKFFMRGWNDRNKGIVKEGNIIKKEIKEIINETK